MGDTSKDEAVRARLLPSASRARCVLPARPMRVAVVVVSVVSLAIGIWSCGYSRLPQPPYTQQPTSALVEVPYPPPPAKVEFVPPQPKKEAVWLDGEWTWHGSRWSWTRGRWVIPAPGTAFSPRTLVRNQAGILYWAPGKWRDPKTHAEVSPPEVVVLARPSAGEITDTEGDTTKTGKDLFPEGYDAGRRRPPRASEDGGFPAGDGDLDAGAEPP